MGYECDMHADLKFTFWSFSVFDLPKRSTASTCKNQVHNMWSKSLREISAKIRADAYKGNDLLDVCHDIYIQK